MIDFPVIEINSELSSMRARSAITYNCMFTFACCKMPQSLQLEMWSFNIQTSQTLYQDVSLVGVLFVSCDHGNDSAVVAGCSSDLLDNELLKEGVAA